MQAQITRRQWLRVAAAAQLVAATGALPRAFAQTADANRILVGFPAGGTADSLARTLAPLLATELGPVTVENRPGASGQLAADAVRQARDASTFLLTPSSILSLVPHLYRKPMFDSLRDFAPVGVVCDHSLGLAVSANFAGSSVAEFVAWAKRRPGEATFATPGLGTAPHFLGVMFAKANGLTLTHVPYKGVAPGLQDLIGGHVVATFNPIPTMVEFHRAGKIRVLAVSSPNRARSLSQVPTFTELGMPSLELVEWYGMFLPAGAPAPAVQRGEGALERAVRGNDFASAAVRLEVEPRTLPGSRLKELLQADHKRWADIVKDTGIQLD
jgi:tripartite-type tricarboxylate transporter receptor subunit TctC